MMKLSRQALERAEEFIYKNGRLLDRKRYELFFANGSREAVLSVLRAYQNEDGGFGNALEPDIRCPHSQPVPTEMALHIMEEIEAFDGSILEGMVRYLSQITVKDSGGFPLAFRSVNDYPHAPWWKTERDNHASMNPTGTIMGLLLKQKVKTDFNEDPWFQQSLQYVWNQLDRDNPSGYHDGVQWITFLQHTPDRVKADKYISLLDEWLSRPDTIERNPKAQGYIHKVLDWAPTRDSYCAKFISEEEFNQHLSHLVDQQQEDGGWPISWPAVSPAGEMEWRGWLTVQRLKTLKSFGWL
jgi:hypothetical protein